MSGWLDAALPLRDEISVSTPPVIPLSISLITPVFPSLGFIPSAVFHAAILSLCLYPPLFRSWTPPRIIEAPWVDLRSEDQLILTKLTLPTSPSLEIVQAAMPALLKPSAAASSDHNFGPSKTLNRVTNIPSVKPTLSGPQEIISIAEKPTNSIQTILRPDLENPANLKFPELVKPVVSLVEKLPAHDLRPPTPTPEDTSTRDSVDLAVDHPSLHPIAAPAMPREDSPMNPPSKPAVESPARNQTSAIVLNAIIVPDNAPPLIPMAELQGSFVVSPVSTSQSSSVTGATEKQPGSSIAITNASKPIAEVSIDASGSHLEHAILGGTDRLTPSAKTSEDINAATPKPSRSNRVSGVTLDTGSNIHIQSTQDRSGITIVGGTNRSGSKSGVRSSGTSSYGLTVISSGSTGGAGRDTGAFERSETVFTIYIPMADLDGPDWSLQYAILGAAPSDGGMLTPPVIVKKVPAILTGDSRTRLSTIFLAGIISATGEVTMKIPLQMDVHTRQAMDAVSQWRFLPSKLRGFPVAVKVLIGVAPIWR